MNARHVIDIVTTKFAPDDVELAVSNLFQEPAWEQKELLRGILRALRSLAERIVDSPRTSGIIAAEVSREPQFAKIRQDDIQKALVTLAASSQGVVTLTGDGAVILHASVDELERRLASLTNLLSPALRPGTFRNGT